VVAGVAQRRLEPRDMTGLLAAIERWKAEAAAAGRAVQRVMLSYEAGRDGFWIARYLLAQVMHPASIPVPRRGRRAKTDRIDLDMLLRTLLPGCGGSRGCVRWRASQVRQRRSCAGRVANRSGWPASGSNLRAAWRICSVCMGSSASSRASRRR